MMPKFLAFVFVSLFSYATAQQAFCPEGQELQIACSDDKSLLTGINVPSTTLTDVTPVCSELRSKVITDQEVVSTRFYPTQQSQKQADCNGSHNVAEKLKICIKENRIVATAVYCRRLKESSSAGSQYDVESTDTSQGVKCNSGSVLNAIYLTNTDGRIKFRVHCSNVA